MSRVRTADKCLDVHVLEVKGEPRTFSCQRQRGHRSYHQAGAIQWGQLWGRKDPTLPPPRRAGAPPRSSTPSR